MRKQFLQAFEKIILFFHFLHEFSFYMTEIFRRHAVTQTTIGTNMSINRPTIVEK